MDDVEAPRKTNYGMKERYKNFYPQIDKKFVRENFKCDADTGRIYRYYGRGGWKIVKRIDHMYPGKYLVKIKGLNVAAHDISWFLHKGDWPKEKIVALDGNLQNTRIDNLVIESSTTDRLGNYLVRALGNGYWECKVWHHPYFYRGSSFKTEEKAKAWGEQQLLLYNQYAFPTEAAAESTSEERETPAKGIYDFKPRKLYTVKVRLNDEWRHFSYEKNIEDALEAQALGQQEVDEIWGT